MVLLSGSKQSDSLVMSDSESDQTAEIMPDVGQNQTHFTHTWDGYIIAVKHLHPLQIL